MEEALETIGVEKNRMIIEEQELMELKSELADYKEDISEFKEVTKRIDYAHFTFISIPVQVISSLQ